MNEQIKAGSDLMAGDGGYSIGTKQECDELAKKREQSSKFEDKIQTMLVLEYNVSQALKATYENLVSGHYTMSAWFQFLYLEAMCDLLEFHNSTPSDEYFEFLDFIKTLRQ